MKAEIQDNHNIYSFILRDTATSKPWTVDIPKNAPLSVFFDAVREIERVYTMKPEDFMSIIQWKSHD
jgi:hypothetical protein